MTVRSVARFPCVVAPVALYARAGASSKYDVLQLGVTNAVHPQIVIDEALRSRALNRAGNGASFVSVVDVMIDAGAVLGYPCYADPKVAGNRTAAVAQ